MFLDDEPNKPKKPKKPYTPPVSCGDRIRLIGREQWIYLFGIKGEVYTIGAILILEESQLPEYHLDGMFTDGEGRHEFILYEHEFEIVQ